MSGRAVRSEASVPRVLVLDAGKSHEVFDVVGYADGIVRVRTQFLFEVGEQLDVRIEQHGTVFEAVARVRAHGGPIDAQITELELSDQTEPRRVVSG